MSACPHGKLVTRAICRMNHMTAEEREADMLAELREIDEAVRAGPMAAAQAPPANWSSRGRGRRPRNGRAWR